MAGRAQTLKYISDEISKAPYTPGSLPLWFGFVGSCLFLFCFRFDTLSHSAAQADFKLTLNLLPQPLKCRDYKHDPFLLPTSP